MVVTLRSGRELESRKEEDKRKTEKDEQEETGKEDKLSNSEMVKETEKEEVQIEKGKLKKERGNASLQACYSVSSKAVESKDGRTVL